jgi:hypothetical protein
MMTIIRETLDIETLRVLFHEKIKDKQENVLFIGFNSPAFVDEESSKFIDDRLP